MPQVRVRVRAQGKRRGPPKTQVSLVPMRPYEFSLRVPTWTRLEVRLLI